MKRKWRNDLSIAKISEVDNILDFIYTFSYMILLAIYLVLFHSSTSYSQKYYDEGNLNVIWASIVEEIVLMFSSFSYIPWMNLYQKKKTNKFYV
jgi:hypothetical protein